MRLYHRTVAVEAILAEGFRDDLRHGTYGTGEDRRGVFLSDYALDGNEGAGRHADWAAHGGTLPLLAIDIDADLISEFEWVDEDTAYREWCVPAQIVNRHGTVRLLSEEEVEEAELDWVNHRLAVLRDRGLISEDEYRNALPR